MARTTTTEKTKTRKGRRGRPKGTPNAEAARVQAELPRCDGCGSTDLKSLRVIAETKHHGVRNGQRYTSIVRRRVQCAGCGKVHIITSYPYDPKQWVDGTPVWGAP